MKAKMTSYQDGGKMPADSKKQELAKKLFGSIPKFNKEEARRGMMAEKIKKLQKEYDYWTKKGEPTTASGVKVQMDKVREDMKNFAGGGKMDMYLKGGKVKKGGFTEDTRNYIGAEPSRGVVKVNSESTRTVKNGKTEYVSTTNISDNAGKSQRIVSNKDGESNTYFARKSNSTTPVKVGPNSPSKTMVNINGRGYSNIEKEVRPGISNAQSVSDLERAKKMMYQKGGKVENKVKRLENREASLVSRGSKAVDEGRERKADRLLGRAARVENRVIKTKESAPVKKMAGGGKMEYGMGGKMKRYLMGGQVKLDKNKDGKISAVDFKMMKKNKQL